MINTWNQLNLVVKGIVNVHAAEREMPPCEARVLAWYGCAEPENASVADVYYEYSSGGLDRTTALKLLVT